MSQNKKNRKAFYLETDVEKKVPLTAGGVIIYKIIKNEVYLLLSQSRGMFEDLGGCVDDEDESIRETVAREADEESNGKIKKKEVLARLNDAKHVEIIKSKYIVYVIKATNEEEKLVEEDFGTKEFHDNIDRIIKWVKLSSFLLPEVIKFKLNFRLKNNYLFALLKNIIKKPTSTPFGVVDPSSESDASEEKPQKKESKKIKESSEEKPKKKESKKIKESSEEKPKQKESKKITVGLFD